MVDSGFFSLPDVLSPGPIKIAYTLEETSLSLNLTMTSYFGDDTKLVIQLPSDISMSDDVGCHTLLDANRQCTFSVTGLNQITITDLKRVKSSFYKFQLVLKGLTFPNYLGETPD